MIENKNYCMGCMKEIDPEETICPHCSYNTLSSQKAPFLSKGNIISGKYLVGKVESFSVDSITYIGLDTESDTTVSIIEFYPEKIVSRAVNTAQVNIRQGYEEMFRASLQSFIDLWTDLKETVGFACLPLVTDILLYNSTAYAVCRYKDCITLESYFAERSPLPVKKALSAFKGILMALKKLHSIGVIHGSISPKSVFVGADGRIHLGRFTIKQCHSINTELRAKPVSGFAPLELYGDSPAAGPYSDIYSFVALLYYAVTGTVPTDSTKRAIKDDMVLPSQIAENLTKTEVTAIIRGLAVHHSSRISDAGELMAMLYSHSHSQQRAPQAPKAAPVRPAAQKQHETKQVQRKTVTKPPKNIRAVSAEEEIPVKKAEKSVKKKDSNNSSNLVPIMIGTFAGVIAVCFIIFTVLYTTVLYKSISVHFIDSMFSSVSFLPMNKEAENVNNDIDDEPSTQTPVNNERSYVTVPDFKVHTYDSIQTNEVFNRNFTIKYKFQTSKEYEKNSVISQSLTVGESVLSGSQITLVISEGVPQVELIDVIGMPYQAAKEKLEIAGFKVKQDLRKNDGSHPEGEVFLMSKVAGLEFDEGTEIVLTVWDEEETTTKETTSENSDTTSEKNSEE